MTEAEIQISPDGVSIDCCPFCLEIALDAAYCDGFVREDPYEEIELDEDVEVPEEVDILEVDNYRSYYDGTDFIEGDFEDG